MTATDDRGAMVGNRRHRRPDAVHLREVRRLLAAAGGGFEHIVQTTEYVLPPRLRQDRRGAPRVVQGAAFPAATGVMVAGLVREGALIEIKGIAVLPG